MELVYEELPKKMVKKLLKSGQYMLPIFIEINGEPEQIFFDKNENIWWYCDKNSQVYGIKMIILTETYTNQSKKIPWEEF